MTLHLAKIALSNIKKMNVMQTVLWDILQLILGRIHFSALVPIDPVCYDDATSSKCMRWPHYCHGVHLPIVFSISSGLPSSAS